MLLTLLGVLVMPVWLTHRWLTLRNRLPDNILLALRQEGDTVTLTVRKGAPITPNQLTGLLTAQEADSDVLSEPKQTYSETEN